MYEWSLMEGMEDASYDDDFLFGKDLDPMEDVGDAFADGGLHSYNDLFDNDRAGNDVSKDRHSVSEPEAPGISEQMSPGAGNYKANNHGNSNGTFKNEMETVEHEAPTVKTVEHKAPTLECIEVMCNNEPVRDKTVKLEAPEPCKESAMTIHDTTGHVGTDKLNAHEAATIKGTVSDKVVPSNEPVGDKVVPSNEPEMEAPEREGSKATEIKVNDKHPGIYTFLKADNLHGTHAAGSTCERNHPVQHEVGHIPEDMLGPDKCPNAGGCNTMKDDLTDILPEDAELCRAGSDMTPIFSNLLSSNDRNMMTPKPQPVIPNKMTPKLQPVIPILMTVIPMRRTATLMCPKLAPP
jgi:hypothetical protein